METTTKDDIVFDLTKTLIIIEKDGDLNDMFSTKYGTDYKMAHASINSGNGLKPEAEKYIKALFDSVILEKSALCNKYLSLADNIEVVDDPVVETPKVVNEKPKNKKRWGLKAIADDIANCFGGKDKQIHRTANKVQDLKKIFTRLEMRMWNERFNKETLTDNQLREINGAVETFNKKVESIINPK